MSSTGKSIKVKIHLHTILSEQTGDSYRSVFELGLEGETTILDLMNKLKIVYHPESILIVVNGKITEPNSILHDDDEIHFIPAISGG